MFFVWIWLDFVLKRARQYLPLVALLGGCTGWELAMVMWEKRQVLLQKHNGTAQCTLAQNCRINHLQTFAHKKRRTQKCEKICCKYFHIKGKHRNVRKKSASNICTQKNVKHRNAENSAANQLTACQLRVRDLFAKILPKNLLLLHIFHFRGLSVQLRWHWVVQCTLAFCMCKLPQLRLLLLHIFHCHVLSVHLQCNVRPVCTNPAKTAAAPAHISLSRLKCAVQLRWHQCAINCTRVVLVQVDLSLLLVIDKSKTLLRISQIQLINQKNMALLTEYDSKKYTLQ